MHQRPSVLLLDDGELDDVRELLDDIDADVLHMRGGAIPEAVDPPQDLFIATSRRALAASPWPPSRGEPRRPAKLVIVTEDSKTLRHMLRRLAFDFLVRRPVHPHALRLLLQRCLFTGKEQRRSERVAIGYEVSYRSGLWKKTAILADLSLRGCRLLSPHPVPLGTNLTLQIPRQLSNGKAFPLRGKVIRTRDGRDRDGQREYTLAMMLLDRDAATRERVRQILALCAESPAVLPESAASSAAATPLAAEGQAAAVDEKGQTVEGEGVEPQPSEGEMTERVTSGLPQAAPASPDERRKVRRGAYQREVVALGGDAPQVLMGRDLSDGGMRVEPNPDLEPGTKLRLAIYGAAREEPFLVEAEVVRNEGDDGVALQFEALSPDIVQRLERLVASLPAVESLEDGETGSVGTVVSQVLAAHS
jgi:hypothetical protein